LNTALLVIEIVQVAVCLVLAGIVLFQSGKSAGLSGAISGAADSFLMKNKAKSMDAQLAKATKWVAIVFVVLTLVINILLKGVSA